MTWIITTAILLLAFWSLIGWGSLLRQQERHLSITAFPRPHHIFLVASGVLCLWIAITLASMLHTVGQREVGIVYNFSRTIEGRKDPGVVMTAPWHYVEKENVGIQHLEYDLGTANSAVSRDQQPVTAKIAVNFQINSANVLDLYRRVGPRWKDIIIDSRVLQDFKEITATYGTPDLVTKREQLRQDMKKRLSEELAPYDITVVDVFVRNLGFSKSYTDSIEAKQRQVQDALRAEARIRQVQAEAEQKVAAARGEAQANVARAQGEATANRLRQQSLTPMLLQLEAIKRLNPQAQLIVCPPNSVCVPNTVTPNPTAAP